MGAIVAPMGSSYRFDAVAPAQHMVIMSLKCDLIVTPGYSESRTLAALG